jgi:hypothetical protein
MPKDNQDKEVNFLLKATGNGGATTQSELMPKDYQEIERIMEEFDIKFPAINENSYEILEKLDTKTNGERIARAISYNTARSEYRDWLRTKLTTYGNSRALEAVEKVEKGVPECREDFDYDSDERGYNECRAVILDHIERVKKELK